MNHPQNDIYPSHLSPGGSAPLTGTRRGGLLGEERTLHDLAWALEQTGDNPEAETLHREALEVNRELLGDEHGEVARSINWLGGMFAHRGDYERAEQMFREALAIRRRLLDSGQVDAVDVANSLTNLGELDRARGNLDDAGRYYRKAVDIQRQAYGSKPLLTEVRPLLGLGSTLIEAGNAEAAEPFLSEAVTIRQENLPEGHWLTAVTESSLGECVLLLGRYESAESLLVGAYPRIRTTGNMSADENVRRLIALYDAWGKPDKAAEWRAKLAELQAENEYK